jgi:hypothetical protein
VVNGTSILWCVAQSMGDFTTEPVRWFWAHAHSGKTEHIPPAEIHLKTEAMLLGILERIGG